MKNDDKTAIILGKLIGGGLMIVAVPACMAVEGEAIWPMVLFLAGIAIFCAARLGDSG